MRKGEPATATPQTCQTNRVVKKLCLFILLLSVAGVFLLVGVSRVSPDAVLYSHVYGIGTVTARPTTYWTPDWMLEKDVTKLFANRLKRVKEQCGIYEQQISKTMRKSYFSSSHTPKNNGRVLTTAHGFSVCLLPKAGSTFWKSLARKLHNVSDPTGDLSMTTVDLFWARRIAMLKIIEEKAPVAYITRNPWHRLVSVYTQKIIQPPSVREKRKFFHVCNHKWRQEMSFEQFLRCAADQMEKGSFNIHWEPVFRHCDICNHEYTTPIAMENMKGETSFILKSLGINSCVQMMDEVRNSTMRDVEAKRLSQNYADYYEELSDLNLVERLKNLYLIELEMFGYPHSPFSLMTNESMILT